MPRIKRKISAKIPYKIIAVVLCMLLIISGVLAIFSTTLFAGEKIYKGVIVGGIAVGGLTKAEAAELIAKKTDEALGDSNIDVIYRTRRHSIDLTDKIHMDSAAAVEAAYGVGREGTVAERLPVVFGIKTEIPLAVSYDEKYIMSKITAFAQEIESENGIFTVSEDYTTAKIDLSRGHVLIDAEATFERFKSNGNRMRFEDIEAVTVTEFDERSAGLISSRLNREPVNATCEIINNKVSIKKHKPGINVNSDAIAENIKKGNRVFEVEITSVTPEVTVEKLEASMFNDVLGSYSTKYNASNASRTKNMAIAAGKINGVVIPAGEKFSFNKIVGERTYAKGYQDANVYVGGRIEQGVGGGICQVVSTLYSAQLYADLETVVRHNHLFTVSYLPLGQDATVSWNSIDYVFRNNTSYPIKITASVGEGVHAIRILGTKADPERKVKIVTSTISTSQPVEKVSTSPDIAAGKTVVTQSGQVGAVVDTYKVYLRNGVEEDRIFLHRSTYTAMDRIVTKGTGKSGVDTPAVGEETEGDGGVVPLPPDSDSPDSNLPNSGSPNTVSPNPNTQGDGTAQPDNPPTDIPDDFLSDNGL